MKKFLKWTGIVLAGIFGMILLASLVLYPIGMKKLTRSFQDIRVGLIDIPPAIPDALDHGRHVAVIWGCSECHGENMGGKLFTNDPFLGTIVAPNLTSGNGGIAGSFTDTDWIRAIRHGVKPDGQAEIFMYDYSTMSDLDLGDLITYLKQIPPVDSNFPPAHIGLIPPIAPAIGLFIPAADLINHDAPRPMNPIPGATVDYGKYLSAICFNCHGADLAGKLETWKQEDFIKAIRTGDLPDGGRINPEMSSESFTEMNDTELTALWLYLHSLSPVK